METRWAAWVIAASVVVGCGGSDAADAGAGDAAPDASVADGGPTDGGVLARDAEPSDAGPMDAGPRDAGPRAHADMLAELGVDTTLDDAPVGPDGTALPTGYHPMRRRYSVLERHDEIYWAGWYDGVTYEGVAEDGFGEAPFASRLTPRDTTWQMNADRAAVAIDVDGDGIDEVLAVYYVAAARELRARVIDGQTSDAGVTSYSDATPRMLASGIEDVMLPEGHFRHAIVAANVDDDPAEELIVGFRNLFVFDDAAHQFAPLLTVPLGVTRMSVTAGDFDAAPGDPTDEFAVLYADGPLAYVDIYDGTMLVSHRDAIFALNDTPRTVFVMSDGFVSSGNFDRDAADELVFYGRRRDVGEWHVVMMDDANSGYSWFRGLQRHIPSTRFGGGPVPVLEVLDVDGDHVDEVFVDFQLLRGFVNMRPSSSTAVETDAHIQLPEGMTVTPLPAYYETVGFIGDVPFPALNVTSGNVSPIGEVVPDRVGTEELVTIHPSTGVLMVGTLDGTGTFGWTTLRTGGYGAGLRDVLVTANLDDDSPIVRYDGEHEVLYSDPEVIALLSAAPCFAADSGVSQNLGNCYTSFGVAAMEQNSTERSYGVTAGWSIGYEANLFGVAKASWKLTFEAGFDRVSASGRERYDSITYATGFEDSVVFTTVPYDVYYYTVVSAPRGHGDEVGNRLTINMPRRTQTLLTSSSFYDSHNGTLPDTASLFHHTVGDPMSYRDRATVTGECRTGACFASRPATVGEGTGYLELLVSSGESMTRRESFDFAITLETEAQAGGWSVGRSTRFSYGSAIQATTTEFTVFTGRVGHIAGLTAARTYDFGLVAHPVAFGSGMNQTMLVDYWVE